MNRFGIGVRIDGHDVAPYILEGGSIDYGRSTMFEPSVAPSAVLHLFTRDGWPQEPRAWFDYGVGDWGQPSGFAADHDTQDAYVGPGVPLYIGAPVWISATTTSGFAADHDTQDTYLGFESRRFTGKIQSLEYSLYRVTVVCSSSLEEWAHVGILEPPEFILDEVSDTDRALDLAHWSNAPTTLHIEGAAGPLVRQVESTEYPVCLLAALQVLADDCDGLLYQNREGNVIYRSRNWSDPAPVDIPSHIAPSETLDMVLELGSMENTVLLEYGASTSIRWTVYETRDSSVTKWGTRTGYYDTTLVTYAAALNHTLTIIDQLAPQWACPDVEMRMAIATDAEVMTVCDLEQGYPVVLRDLPLGAPVPLLECSILGWTEDLASEDWTITLHLAPFIRPTIADVPPTT